MDSSPDASTPVFKVSGYGFIRLAVRVTNRGNFPLYFSDLMLIVHVS
jgi:hypothetical protein